MGDAELQALLDAASPGPWHHVNAGKWSHRTHTIHGTVPAEPIDYVSTWPGLGTPPGHRVVINRDGGVRSADMALIAEAPALAAEVLALRAGAAASADRIKALEAAMRDALPHLEGCFTHHVWRNEPMPEPGYLKNIRALLKEPDQ